MERKPGTRFLFWTRQTNSWVGTIGTKGAAKSDGQREFSVVREISAAYGGGYLVQVRGWENNAPKGGASYVVLRKARLGAYEVVRFSGLGKDTKAKAALDRAGVRVVAGVALSQPSISPADAPTLLKSVETLLAGKHYFASKFMLFDMSKSAGVEAFRQATLQAPLDMGFQRLALEGTGKSPIDPKADHCMNVRYNPARYSVVTTNKCDYKISLSYCYKSKTSVGTDLLNLFAGNSSQTSQQYNHCEKHVLTPGRSFDFVWLRDQDRGRAPGWVGLASPVSYQLSAKRNGV
jgi:hypothetical protein